MTWTVIAWVIAAASAVAYLIALTVGPSCADSATPWCSAFFFGAWVLLALQHDQKGRR